MATRTVTTLVDDLDGGLAEENVAFGLDRVDYEIDLSADHAGSLRDVLAPYLAAARRIGGRRSTRAQPPRSAGSGDGGNAPTRSRATNAEIRAWATSHGVTLAERGRIPGRVIEAFEAGDASRLSDAAGAASPNDPPAAPERPSTADSPDQPLGRDGVTASERDTIRAWAVDQGIEVKSRGLLKKDLIANYRAWQGRQ